MGAVAKTFGVLLLIVGILLLLGGAGLAATAYMDQEDNEEGLLSDPERGEDNEDMMMAGAAGAGLGLVLLILGIVLASSGSKVVVVNAAGAEAAKPVKGTSGPKPASKRGVWALPIVGGIVVLVLVALVLSGNGGTAAEELFGGGSSSPESGILGLDSFNGTVEMGASGPLLGSVTNGDNDHDFTAPMGTASLRAVVDWTEGAGGSGQLEVILTLQDGTELARQSGGPGFTLEFAGSQLSGAALHYQVFPDDMAGAVAQQAFTVTTTFLG